MATSTEPVACTLTASDAADQLLEWSDLQNHAIGVEALPAGARMRFPAALEPLVNDLVHRESACCAFLDITLTRAGDHVVVEVTSPNPDALPIISVLAGIPTT